MHRYYTRNRDSKPSRKVHSVSATECYWLSAQLQTIVQRFCTWQRRYGKVSRFKSFAKPSFSSRGGNVSRFRLLFAFICAKTFLSLNRVSTERGINTRNLYIEHFRILISVAINPFWFFDISTPGMIRFERNVRDEKIHRHNENVIFFFFFLFCYNAKSYSRGINSQSRTIFREK